MSRQHPEDDLQAGCIKVFAYQYPKYVWRFFAIPNGGKRDAITAALLKKQGVLSGAWDLFLSVPSNGFGGLFLEAKAGKNTLTENQKAFRDANKHAYAFMEFRSVEEFLKCLKEYLN